MASLIDKIRGGSKPTSSLIDKIKRGTDTVRGVGTSRGIEPTKFDVPVFEKPEEKPVFESRKPIPTQEQIAALGKPRAIVGDVISTERAATILAGMQRPTRVRTESILGAASRIPGIGELLVSEEARERIGGQAQTALKVPEAIPGIGGAEVTTFQAGEGLTQLGLTSVQYGAINNALSKVGTTSKLGKLLGTSRLAKFGAAQATDLLADTIIQTPKEVMDAINQDKTIDQASKDFLVNRGVDVLFNLAIGGTGEALQSLRKLNADPAMAKQIDDKIKTLNPEDAKVIRDSLETKVDVPLSPATKQFQPTTPTRIDDFQAWRSRNFGGATGRMSEGDIKALRDLYFESTGKYLADAELTQFAKSGSEILFEETRRRIPPLETPTGTARATFEEVPSRNPIIDRIKRGEPSDALKQEVPLTPKRLTEESDQIKGLREDLKTAEGLMGSPREADIPTPLTEKQRVGRFFETARKSDVTTKELKKKIKDLEIGVTSNEARTALARQIVDEDFETAVRMVKEGDQFGSAVESEIGRDLVGKLQQQGRDSEAVEVIEAMAKKFNRAGKDVQAASIWSRNTPEGMQKWATNTLNEANIKFDDALIKEIGDDIRTIDQMTPEELGKRVAERLGKLGESELIQNQILKSNSYDQLKALNTQLTMGKVFDKIPIVKARKLSSIQAMSHLLNGRTFLRNIFGNTASLAGEIMSRVPASVADRGLSMFTGNRSVIANMPKWKQTLNQGWQQGQRSFFEIAAGASRAKQGKYELLFGSSFKSKPAKGLEKVLAVSLQTPDEFFKGFSKADSLYNQVQARLGKEVKKMSFDEVLEKSTKEEIETAIKEAEFATFQNDSGLADLMSKTKSLLNRVHLDSSKKFLKETGEFGLGDLVLKYTRVPGNIITRGFEYSPVGYTKAVKGILDLASLGKDAPPQLQREIAMQIGRATTGSGLIWAGMKLADLGIITGAEDSRDYDVQAFDRAEGLGDYKVNMDALVRLVNGEDPTPQKGDTLKSYNWLQPMTIPVAVGARLQTENPGTPREALAALGNATWEESMDLPTLYVVKKMFYESMKEGFSPKDAFAVPIEEALPGFVPSIVRQTAQALDPTVRDISGDEFVNRIKANIPLLSKTLPPRIDPLGREVQRQPGIVPSLIDPSTTTTAQPTEFGNKLRQIQDITGKTTIFPDRKPPKTTTLKGEKIELTPDEQREWQRLEGQFVNEQYTRLLKTIDITDQNALQVAEALENIKKQAGQFAKESILSRRR